MRYTKKEILSTISTLEKVNNTVKRATVKGLMEINELYEDCQTAAISIATGYEEVSKNENSPEMQVVHILEEYCEHIYQLSIQTTNPDASHKTAKKIQNCLYKIKNIITYDMPEDNLVVAFFPYKISMWDCMESIYYAALETPNCDVYVVPIPYYEKNTDGAVRELIYEGEFFPKDIHITKWEEFSLEKIQPNIAFIHNPYDEYNLITSVHPMFFSSNLKKYVNQLIYVPYYATGGCPGDMHSILPAYIHGDVIVVQNEKQKEIIDSRVASKVYVGGSPKFDKVLNTKKEELSIPATWKEKLHEKVIFVNTGINGILVHGEDTFVEIQQIILSARDRGITLIWRPHPLIEATINSMRPELLKTYQETMNCFLEYENGILDMTGTPENAIALSDAYMGEPTSSIAHMFGVLGKPLFFLKPQLKYKYTGKENWEVHWDFKRLGKNLPWAAKETQKQTVSTFMKYVIEGKHDRNLQKEQYGCIAENLDGSSGKKIFEFVMNKYMSGENK